MPSKGSGDYLVSLLLNYPSKNNTSSMLMTDYRFTLNDQIVDEQILLRDKKSTQREIVTVRIFVESLQAL